MNGIKLSNQPMPKQMLLDKVRLLLIETLERHLDLLKDVQRDLTDDATNEQVSDYLVEISNIVSNHRRTINELLGETLR